MASNYRAIKTLGTRVENEHSAHLRSTSQLQNQNQPQNGTNGMSSDSWITESTNGGTANGVTFEQLLNGSHSTNQGLPSNGITSSMGTLSMQSTGTDDVWGTLGSMGSNGNMVGKGNNWGMNAPVVS